jgi:hypothetical protein
MTKGGIAMCYKTGIMLGALAIVVPVPAIAGWGIVSSCPAPCAEPRDLNVYGECYLVGDGPAPQVFRIDPQNGSVYYSFAAPGGLGAWGITGIANPTVLYLSNYRTSWIYKITTNGSVLSSYRCPLPGPAGISWEGPNRLEVTIPDLNVVAALNLNEGYLISAFRGPGSRPTACLGENAEFIGDAGTHTVYRSSVSRWYPIITGIETPAGFDGYQYINDTPPGMGLYIVDAATKYIYNYEDNAPVTPASLGRVKALFQ